MSRCLRTHSLKPWLLKPWLHEQLFACTGDAIFLVNCECALKIVGVATLAQAMQQQKNRRKKLQEIQKCVMTEYKLGQFNKTFTGVIYKLVQLLFHRLKAIVSTVIKVLLI